MPLISYIFFVGLVSVRYAYFSVSFRLVFFPLCFGNGTRTWSWSSGCPLQCYPVSFCLLICYHGSRDFYLASAHKPRRAQIPRLWYCCRLCQLTLCKARVLPIRGLLRDGAFSWLCERGVGFHQRGTRAPASICAVLRRFWASPAPFLSCAGRVPRPRWWFGFGTAFQSLLAASLGLPTK